jgi:hypothetical protein
MKDMKEKGKEPGFFPSINIKKTLCCVLALGLAVTSSVGLFSVNSNIRTVPSTSTEELREENQVFLLTPKRFLTEGSTETSQEQANSTEVPTTSKKQKTTEVPTTSKKQKTTTTTKQMKTTEVPTTPKFGVATILGNYKVYKNGSSIPIQIVDTFHTIQENFRQIKSSLKDSSGSSSNIMLNDTSSSIGSVSGSAKSLDLSITGSGQSLEGSSESNSGLSSIGIMNVLGGGVTGVVILSCIGSILYCFSGKSKKRTIDNTGKTALFPGTNTSLLKKGKQRDMGDKTYVQIKD